jgi:4'-phosphopantetheinyl transferase
VQSLINSSQNRRLEVEKISSSDFRIASPLSLDRGRIALWHLDLAGAADSEARWLELLSTDERERAGRFHFDRDRQHFCAARGILRTLLAAYLTTRPLDISFVYSDKGKPALAPPYAESGLNFNVSHSGEAALLGFVQSSRIGVDVEKIRNDFDSAAIAGRFFSPHEREQLSRLPSDQRHRAFFHCWTLKEAFIKALGEGLSHPLHQFDVTFDASWDRSVPISLTTRPDPSESGRWWLQTVDVDPDYAAALAVSQDA